MALERHYRLAEVAELVPYAVATLRKKIARREIASVKIGRRVCVPQREVERLLSGVRPAVALKADGN